jgi:hypothetical protein
MSYYLAILNVNLWIIYLQLKQNHMKEREKWKRYGQFLRSTIRNRVIFMTYSTAGKLLAEVGYIIVCYVLVYIIVWHLGIVYMKFLRPGKADLTKPGQFHAICIHNHTCHLIKHFVSEVQMPGNNTNRSNLHAQRGKEQAKSGECLLPFGSESPVLPPIV